MPDVFALAQIPSLTRLRTPELEVAVADDGADAKTAAVDRLTTMQHNLGITLNVIDAVEGRIQLRRPLPPIGNVEPLQSLARRGRRRLERERQGATRALHDVRLDAVIKLRGALGA